MLIYFLICLEIALLCKTSSNRTLFYNIAACKSASETKVISHAVRQPVFLRSMSAPSDLEMIGNEDLEFTRSSQRYADASSLNCCMKHLKVYFVFLLIMYHVFRRTFFIDQLILQFSNKCCFPIGGAMLLVIGVALLLFFNL